MTPTRRVRVASAAAAAPGPDDAQHRQVVAAPEVAQGDRGGGVAGHDERLDVTLHQLVQRLHAEPAHLVVGPDAVRGPGVVAQVDGRFERQAAQDLTQDGQTADARVEYTDGTRVGHASVSHRSAGRAAHDGLGGTPHVTADRRVGARDHEGHALVVGLRPRDARPTRLRSRAGDPTPEPVRPGRCRRSSPTD